jgi:Ca-activated chloride channel family protein
MCRLAKARGEVVKAVILILAAAVLIVPGRAGAQASPQHADTPSTVFRTGVDLVALNVVVTDGQQKYVSGLSAGDFAVFEDGVQQDVSFFAAKDLPLDLALLLDTSASMTDKMQTMQEAAVGFTATLRPGDRVSIVDVKDSIKVLHALDTDPAGAAAAIRRTSARGGTALYNGLYMTLKEMVKQRRDNGEVRRQAIAVLSDGDDTASLIGFEDVMEVAKQSGIVIYTITLKSPYVMRTASNSGSRSFSQSEYSMKALAQETGARAFFPSSIGELAAVYGSIAEELASQYALGYTPKNPKRDGAFRRVIVRVIEQPGARTRTRSGYQSPRPPRAVSADRVELVQE